MKTISLSAVEVTTMIVEQLVTKGIASPGQFISWRADVRKRHRGRISFSYFRCPG